MRWNDDAIYHRIRAHKADPDVYDPPTFEQMADRIEKLIAENKRINDQITEKQHAAKNGAVTYNGDLAKVVGDVQGDVKGDVKGNGKPGPINYGE